jgi:LuxR family transcriptional regulator, maltose regulon positive regulatory protein
MNPGGTPPKGPRASARVRAGARRRASAGHGGASRLTRSGPPGARVAMIDRPRLYSGPWRRLLLATAPAGYGKTILLKQIWARLPDKGVVKVWLSLGPAHRDFDVLLRDLSGALQAQSFAPPEWRGSPEEMGARLAHAFAEAPEPLYLILDDYHAAAGPELDGFVRTLAGASGDAIYLAIATRARAKVGAAVLAARGDVTFVGATDLAFSLEETRRLFHGRIPKEKAAALHVQTEGWPAALQLACHAVRDETPGDAAAWPISATSGEVGALIGEETFDPLPEELQALLIETAFLEALNADDVDEVRGRGDSAGLLADLERSAALVFPDRSRPDRLRRHLLLRRFLEARFTLWGEDRRGEIAERTISCLARAGEIGSALRLARRCSPRSPSLALLESAPPESFWTAEALLNLPSDLSDLSEACFAGAPRAALVRGLALYASGRMADARAAIEAGLAEMRTGEIHGAGMRAANGVRDWKAWEGLRAAIFDETVSGQFIDDLATIAREARPPVTHALPAHVASVLALRAGRSEEAVVLAQSIAAEGKDGPPARALGAVHEAVTALFDASPQRAAAALARLRGVAFERPNLEAAWRLCAVWLAHERCAPWRGVELPPRDAQPLLLGLSPELFVERARLAAAEAQHADGVEAAGAVLRDARAAAQARGWRRADAGLEAETLTLLARTGASGATARELVESLARHGKTACSETVLALARFDVSSGAYRRARTRLAALLAAPALARRRRVEALIIDARAAHAIEQAGEANLALEQVLAMSREGVMARCFHEDGVGLWEPLMALASKMATIDPNSACLDVLADLAVTRPSCEGGLALAPPTPQESSMFAALRRAGSRAGAARDLAMSENTLKYYLKRVFEKWRVHDWRLAMRIAERLAT